MNKKGFTLIEMLACLALLGIILTIGILVSKDTLATTMTQLSNVSDSEVYQAVRYYVVEENTNFNNQGYTCVTLKDVIDMGYLKGNFDEEFKKKIDEIANKYLEDWDINRLGYTDQAILRMGIYEIMNTDTPDITCIDEAIELSKEYSDDKVCKMINGVLDKVYHSKEK